MRQVGDRLIPVGVTSGRVHALTPEEAAAAGADANGSRRSRRRQAAQGAPLEQFMGMAGQDLEEVSPPTDLFIFRVNSLYPANAHGGDAAIVAGP